MYNIHCIYIDFIQFPSFFNIHVQVLFIFVDILCFFYDEYSFNYYKRFLFTPLKQRFPNSQCMNFPLMAPLLYYSLQIIVLITTTNVCSLILIDRLSLLGENQSLVSY